MAMPGWKRSANNGILPSNIGLDGKIGGATRGKWYGGVYGWSFSPVVPMTGKAEDRNRVPRYFVGFMNAYLLSGGDDKYLDVWRKHRRPFDAQPRGKRQNGHAAHVRRSGLLRTSQATTISTSWRYIFSP